LNNIIESAGKKLRFLFSNSERDRAGTEKAAECAALQTLREIRGSQNLAPAFGVRGIPTLSVVYEPHGAHRRFLITLKFSGANKNPLGKLQLSPKLVV
jgi:hypothetical protein